MLSKLEPHGSFDKFLSTDYILDFTGCWCRHSCRSFYRLLLPLLLLQLMVLCSIVDSLFQQMLICSSSRWFLPDVASLFQLMLIWSSSWCWFVVPADVDSLFQLMLFRCSSGCWFIILAEVDSLFELLLICCSSYCCFVIPAWSQIWLCLVDAQV